MHFKIKYIPMDDLGSNQKLLFLKKNQSTKFGMDDLKINLKEDEMIEMVNLQFEKLKYQNLSVEYFGSL